MPDTPSRLTCLFSMPSIGPALSFDALDLELLFYCFFKDNNDPTNNHHGGTERRAQSED